MTPIDHVAKLVGGQRTLGRILGVAESAPGVWKKRSSEHREAGHLPSEYNAALLAWCKDNGVSHRAVSQYLDRHRCPLCGSALKPGARHVRTAA